MIVGRETAQLLPEDIRRAVIETVAENLADGWCLRCFSPCCWPARTLPV